jgi:hypothetical protein
MRIACCTRIARLFSVLLWACTACTEAPHPSPQQSAVPGARPVVVSSRSENGRTRVELQTGGGRRPAVLFARDSTVSPDAEPGGVDVLAELPGTAIVLVDRYPSVPAGLSLCQAGEEQFLRVVSIIDGGATETLTTKVASCRDNLELAEPGLQWDASAATLRINWLTGPTGKPEVRAIRIGADGRPQPTP